MTSDHNEKTTQELYEEQQLLKEICNLRDMKSEIAGVKADMGQIYARLKDMNWTKKDVEFAMSLQDKDVPSMIEDFEKKIRIARLVAPRLGKQLTLLDSASISPEERAYAEGLAAGRNRGNSTNPYLDSLPQGQEWQRGFNDGTAFVNRDLASELAQSDSPI